MSNPPQHTVFIKAGSPHIHEDANGNELPRQPQYDGIRREVFSVAVICPPHQLAEALHNLELLQGYFKTLQEWDEVGLVGMSVHYIVDEKTEQPVGPRPQLKLHMPIVGPWDEKDRPGHMEWTAPALDWHPHLYHIVVGTRPDARTAVLLYGAVFRIERIRQGREDILAVRMDDFTRALSRLNTIPSLKGLYPLLKRADVPYHLSTLYDYEGWRERLSMEALTMAAKQHAVPLAAVWWITSKVVHSHLMMTHWETSPPPPGWEESTAWEHLLANLRDIARGQGIEGEEKDKRLNCFKAVPRHRAW